MKAAFLNADMAASIGRTAVCLALVLTAAHESRGEDMIANHPNPIWARPWVSLDGLWRFAFDPNDQGVNERWFETHEYPSVIQVPFPWQSELSGINATDYQGAAWYERDVTIPQGFGPRIVLVFGAVDRDARVWLNGEPLGEHSGGYVPFEFDITELVQGLESFRVTLRAFDDTDPQFPTGKQVGWYTPSGGVWQSVYLEARGNSYLESARMYPDIVANQVRFDCVFHADAPGPVDLAINATLNGQSFEQAQTLSSNAGENRAEITLAIPEPKLWSPDSPTLYDATLALRRGEETLDTVNTYFAMRSIGRGPYPNGASSAEYILLNGKPVYLRGALHQSFHPKSLYAYPDDQALRMDYEIAKSLGLNFLRIHIKSELPRALYWADRLGIMLMCDVPNFWRKGDHSKQAWEATLRGMIDRDFNHPSIIAWCNFNETWGIGDGGYDEATRAWVHEMYRLAKDLDSTRLVEDNSPCYYDHTETDINSWHFYIEDFEVAKAHIEEVVEKTRPGSTFNYAEGWTQATAPLLNSEYGGVSAGGGDRDVGWVFLFLTNQLRRHDKICGYVYTELCDIEWEHNGFVNYDRSPKAFPYPARITLAELQGQDFPVLECPPYQRVSAGQEVRIPIAISHWSGRHDLTVRTIADGRAVDGRPWADWIPPTIMKPVELKPFGVTDVGRVDLLAPDARGLMNIVVELLEGDTRVAANYCVLDIRDGAAWTKPGELALSFAVDSFAENTFSGDVALPQHSDKIFGFGTGRVDYELVIPPELGNGNVVEAEMIVEIGAKAASERLGWPARINAQDYPQTDAPPWPTDVRFLIDGTPFHQTTIETDFADVQGVLSHVAGFHHGSHGTVVHAPIALEALSHLLTAAAQGRSIVLSLEVPADAVNRGGISIYGANLGAWPSDPVLVFRSREILAVQRGILPMNAVKSRILTLISHGAPGHAWRYTFDAPDPGWQLMNFPVEGWSLGLGGFGSGNASNVIPATAWDTAEIWLRTEIVVPETFPSGAALLSIYHDEDIEIYVNGALLLSRDGFTTDYEQIRLSPEQAALFRPGGINVIAAHCKQTRGSQFVDLGIALLPDHEPETALGGM